MALLDLFNRTDVPVIVDYDEDEEESDELVVLSCPVNYSNLAASEGEDSLRTNFQKEMEAMRSWYETALAKRQRTTVGVSGIALDALPGFICEFLDDSQPVNPRPDLPLSNMLKMASASSSPPPKA